MQLRKTVRSVLSAILAAGVLLTAMPLSPMNSYREAPVSITAEAASTLRRPCDPEHPMRIVHIDTWNVADPAKVIATIPESIRPYCVFNISLSINWSSDKHEWLMVQDGYECAKSWLKTCSDMGVWCMVQPACAEDRRDDKPAALPLGR